MIDFNLLRLVLRRKAGAILETVACAEENSVYYAAHVPSVFMRPFGQQCSIRAVSLLTFVVWMICLLKQVGVEVPHYYYIGVYLSL